MSKAAIVTGSAGAIGSSIVRALSEAGYFVVGLDVAQTPTADASVPVDLATLAHEHNAASTIHDHILSAIEGRNFQVLVNCAAVQPMGSVDQLCIQDFRGAGRQCHGGFFSRENFP